MVKVESVEAGSLASEAGVLPGDKILNINGQEIRDRLDFEFYRSEAYLELEVMRGDAIRNFAIERGPGQTLGIEPEVMKIHLCKNNCVFCFVHQTPKGMRRSLYVKDEDYRYSFLDGHFTTLSNMGEKEWQRVLEQRLSPIYVSVHATDTELRNRLLKNSRLEPIMDRLRWLREHGIDFHTQLVVVPEWNDGEQMERSIRDLLTLAPALLSISVVPIGLTTHRKGLTELRKFTKEDAQSALDIIDRYARLCEQELGENLVFGSDELYVVAERELPPAEHYGDYSQYENGVGTLRSLIEDFERELPGLPRASEEWEVTVLTAPLAEGTQRGILERLGSERGLRSELLVCENLTFGSTVTVTGLLCGKDFLAALERSRSAGAILIPPNSLNKEGKFLDDMAPAEIGEKTGRPVIVPARFRDYFPSRRGGR